MKPTTHPRRRLGLLGASVAVVATFLPHPAPASASGPTSVLLTSMVDRTAALAPPATGATRPHVSDDGRWVAFESATPLVPGGGSHHQAYLYDRLSGRTRLVSHAPDGTPANADAFPSAISADGARVAFTSTATNLATGKSAGRDLYVADRDGGVQRVNLLPNGQPSEVLSDEDDLSADGKVVAFHADDKHVYVRDLATKVSTRVDLSSVGVTGDLVATAPSLSATGRWVAFASSSTNLVLGDTNGTEDVFVRDVLYGKTERVSVTPSGLQSAGTSLDPSISGDGSQVAFTGLGNDLVFGDTNKVADVFLRSRSLGTTALVSANGGTAGNGASTDPELSADGTAVAFTTEATNLAGIDTNGASDIVVRDYGAGTMYAADLSTAAERGTGDALSATIDGDGSTVAFASDAPNLVAGDGNQARDVFVRARQPLGPHATFGDVAHAVLADFGQPVGGVGTLGTLMLRGWLTPDQMIDQAAHAAPWAQFREPVTRLYQAYFEREPDAGGLGYWVQRRKDGASLSVIATAFAQSPEFKATYGSKTGGAFVKLVYENVLDREPDASGLAYWTDRMAHGLSRGDVMVHFSESPEGKHHLAPFVDATLIGLGMLGQLPSKADWTAAAQAQLQAGVPEAAARFFLTSPAYAARYS